VESSVRNVEGVLCADLAFPSGALVLDYDPGRDPREAVAAIVRAAGHGLETAEEEGAEPSPAAEKSRDVHLLTLVSSGALLAAGYLLELGRFGSGFRNPAPWAFIAATVLGGWVTSRRAWISLRALRLDINALMALAVVGAVVLGDFAEAATVIFLFSLGQLLESRALERTRRSVRDLVSLAPALARVRRHGREVEVRLAEAVVGDTLIVRPGERVALDGVVVSGNSALDEAPITGEAAPVDKAPGDRVFAGSLNASGLLEVEVTAAREDSTLARMIYLVEEAQAQRAPSQRLVDSFTRYYTPIVVAGAVAVAVVPPLAGLGSWHEWAYRALVVLVASCPCALVISTPVAIVSAITRATRDGVLVKGGAHLETAAKVRAIAFDKTGTLTCGRPEVTEVVPLGEASAERVSRLAGALESGSNHPVAEAVLRAAGTLPVEGEVRDLTDVAGRGVRARIGATVYSIGSPAFAGAEGALDEAAGERIDALEATGATVLVLFSDHTALGLIAVADAVRPEAPGVVRRLLAGGMEHVVMLTGDNERAAAAVAAQAGLTEHRARLLPEHKMDAVRELRSRYGSVAMVGDGVNDAPALALADLGVAMGAAGSDTALETADVALMAPDLHALPGFFDLGRRTVAVIRANVVFSIATKAAVLVLAVAGYAPLWLAVFADMGVSLLVTLNGLRLLRSRTPVAA
jgi:Cd2+/Zn2+-exporting ATPase